MLTTPLKEYPWTKQSYESDESYEAFEVFLNMPRGERALNQVAEIVGKNRSLIGRWSARDKWYERAQLYDAWSDNRIYEMRKEAIELYRLEIMQEEVQDHRSLRELWNMMYEQCFQQARDGKLTPLDFERLINSRNKIDDLGRRAAQLPQTYNDRQVPDKTQDDTLESQFLLSWDGVEEITSNNE